VKNLSALQAPRPLAAHLLLQRPQRQHPLRIQNNRRKSFVTATETQMILLFMKKYEEGAEMAVSAGRNGSPVPTLALPP
jgi:hypothetical protein